MNILKNVVSSMMFKDRNLIPEISTKHRKNLPETHNNSTVPIDDIFYISTLKVIQVGYLEHGKSLSDHCPIWMDISKTMLIGKKHH